ncbi:MAG: hypothetical protein WC919_01020 [Candidatus Paceibacterota bacterium]|jgi:hypothetical protein
MQSDSPNTPTPEPEADYYEMARERLDKMMGMLGLDDRASYQKRMEEISIKSAEEALRRTELEREVAQINRDAALLSVDAMRTRIQAEQAECAERLKMAQLAVRHYKEFQRPSRQPGVTIKEVDGRWTMELDGVSATGDTPAMAASEFDHMWVFGENGE